LDLTTTTELLWILDGHVGARIYSAEGGYVLRWPGGRVGIAVLDQQFDDLLRQSYIERDTATPGTVYRISDDGREAVASKP
jgi:hypothetical protein